MKILLLSAFLVISGVVQALPLSYAQGKTVTTTVTDPFYEDVLIEFTNTGTTPVTLSWIGYEESKTNGWQIGMCNNGECRADVLIPGSIGSVNPNESAFLKLHVSAVNITGSARIKFVLYDKNNPADADTLIFNISYVAKALGCDETCNYQDLKLQQNTEGIIFSGTDNAGAGITIQVYDINGRVVLSLPFAVDKTLPLAELKEGIYIIALTNSAGTKQWQQKIFKGSY